MNRREVMAVLGGAASASLPHKSHAQQGEPRRVGVLIGSADDALGRARLGAFRERLSELGWTKTRVRFEERWGGGENDRIAAHAAELVALRPDVILASPVRPVTYLQKATRSIPIVFVASSDPVSQGIVASFARPGGNTTGFSLFELSIVGKMLETLKQMVPGVRRVALLCGTENVSLPLHWRSLESVATKLGIEPVPMPVHTATDIARAIETLSRTPGVGLLTPPDTTVNIHRDLVISLAARHRLPAIHANRYMAEAGGLLSYGVNPIDLYRQAAGYVDRILKGERPAELPVQAPTKFELVINLKTARALGLDMPPMLLARADEVIE
jgi:putative ABC transport system substrate-binding protein